MRKPIIVGNWKMQTKLSEAAKLITEIRDLLFDFEGKINIVVCPSYPHLLEISKLLPDYIKLGAQDMFWQEKGAFTGAVSGSQIKEIGCSYVILGHSERRHIFGEKNEEVNHKVVASLKNNLIPIVCVGEKKEERKDNKTKNIIKNQLETAINNLQEEEMKKLIIAYEPVWAIGTGVAAKGEDAFDVANLIKNIISSKFTKDIANQARILYGGSVTPENVEEFVSLKEIDGVLGGGVSLKAEEFVRVIKITDSVKNK